MAKPQRAAAEVNWIATAVPMDAIREKVVERLPYTDEEVKTLLQYQTASTDKVWRQAITATLQDNKLVGAQRVAVFEQIEAATAARAAISEQLSELRGGEDDSQRKRRETEAEKRLITQIKPYDTRLRLLRTMLRLPYSEAEWTVLTRKQREKPKAGAPVDPMRDVLTSIVMEGTIKRAHAGVIERTIKRADSDKEAFTANKKPDEAKKAGTYAQALRKALTNSIQRMDASEMEEAVARVEAARSRVRNTAVDTLVGIVKRRGIVLIGAVEMGFDAVVRQTWELPKNHRLNRPTDDDSKAFDLPKAVIRKLTQAGMPAVLEKLSSSQPYKSKMQVGLHGQTEKRQGRFPVSTFATHCISRPYTPPAAKASVAVPAKSRR